MSEQTPALKTYSGNCHCGAFKFNIQIPELKSIIECNCNTCFKNGYRWIFLDASHFNIIRGDGILKTYDFGDGPMVHKVSSMINLWNDKTHGHSSVRLVEPMCWAYPMVNTRAPMWGLMYARPFRIFHVANNEMQARTLMDVDLWTLESRPWEALPDSHTLFHPLTIPDTMVLPFSQHTSRENLQAHCQQLMLRTPAYLLVAVTVVMWA